MISDTAELQIANAIREAKLRESRQLRELERESALAANEKDYRISPDSQAALDRGDRQRETGVYQTSIDTEYVPPCLAKTAGNGVYGEHICKLGRGHSGPHQCVAIGYCNKTWGDEK